MLDHLEEMSTFDVEQRCTRNRNDSYWLKEQYNNKYTIHSDTATIMPQFNLTRTTNTSPIKLQHLKHDNIIIDENNFCITEDGGAVFAIGC